jgi:hypothetical protein
MNNKLLYAAAEAFERAYNVENPLKGKANLFEDLDENSFYQAYHPRRREYAYYFFQGYLDREFKPNLSPLRKFFCRIFFCVAGQVEGYKRFHQRGLEARIEDEKKF